MPPKSKSKPNPTKTNPAASIKKSRSSSGKLQTRDQSLDRFVKFNSDVSVSARPKASSVPAPVKDNGRQEKLSAFGFTAITPQDGGGGDAKRRRISGGGAGSQDDPVVIDEVAETQYAGLTQSPGFWEQIAMDAEFDLDNEESPRRPRGIMKPRFSPGEWSAKSSAAFSPRFAPSLKKKIQASATSPPPSHNDEGINAADTDVRQKTPIPVTSEIHNSDTTRELMPPPPVTPKRPRITRTLPDEVPNSQSPASSPLKTQPTQTPSPFGKRLPASWLKARSIVKSSQWYENEDTQGNFSDTESEGEGKLQPFFRESIAGSNNDEAKRIAVVGATGSPPSTSPSVSLAKDAGYLLESASEASQRKPLLWDSLKGEAPAPYDHAPTFQSTGEAQDQSASAVPPGSQLQENIPDMEHQSDDTGSEDAEDISINPPVGHHDFSQERFWLKGTESEGEDDDETESQALMMEFKPVRTQQYPQSMFVENMSPLSPEGSEAGSPTTVSQNLGGLALDLDLGLGSESQFAAVAASDTADEDDTEPGLQLPFTTTQLLPSSLMESFPMPPPMTQESSQRSNDETQ
jgi:hypothetical protein